MKFGEVYYADLTGAQGSEQGGTRPVMIIQNEKGNTYAPTTIAVPLTSRLYKHKIPTHVVCNLKGLSKTSVVLCEQPRTIDKLRLSKKVAVADEETIQKVKKALMISMELNFQ
jgi:mRNA interferase MazF